MTTNQSPDYYLDGIKYHLMMLIEFIAHDYCNANNEEIDKYRKMSADLMKEPRTHENPHVIEMLNEIDYFFNNPTKKV